MANVRSGNSHYVDSTGTLEADDCQIAGVLLTSTAANAVVVLQTNHGTPKNKLTLKLAADGSTQFFDFSQAPVAFPGGLKVGTLTNSIVTVIYDR